MPEYLPAQQQHLPVFVTGFYPSQLFSNTRVSLELRGFNSWDSRCSWGGRKPPSHVQLWPPGLAG